MLLFLPPLTVEKSPSAVLSVPWLTAPVPSAANTTPVVITRAASEPITAYLRVFILRSLVLPSHLELSLIMAARLGMGINWLGQLSSAVLGPFLISRQRLFRNRIHAMLRLWT